MGRIEGFSALLTATRNHTNILFPKFQARWISNREPFSMVWLLKRQILANLIWWSVRWWLAQQDEVRLAWKTLCESPREFPACFAIPWWDSLIIYTLFQWQDEISFFFPRRDEKVPLMRESSCEIPSNVDFVIAVRFFRKWLILYSRSGRTNHHIVFSKKIKPDTLPKSARK